MQHSLPKAAPGQAIGLLGGSFDPPHQGHLHISREAMKRFDLDEVWWLITPGNPLKARGPAPLDKRIAAAAALVDHPRIRVTDLEARIGTTFTAETLAWLIAAQPRARFVWLMGADNLAQFHRWERWSWIMETVPIGVIARPGVRLPARTSRAAARYRSARVPASGSHGLAGCAAPAWCFLNIPMMGISSTEIRARGGWA